MVNKFDKDSQAARINRITLHQSVSTSNFPVQPTSPKKCCQQTLVNVDNRHTTTAQPQATEDSIPARMSLIKLSEEKRNRLRDDEYNQLEQNAR